MIPYNHIAVFVAVIRHGSFTRAAEHLGMPKSTVSLKLSELEKELGLRLVQRSTRQLSLTEGGRRFFEQCRRIVESADSAVRELKELQAEPWGTLRISLPFGMSRTRLPQIVSRYRALYPKVKVEITSDNDWVDIIKEGYDLALRVGPLMDSALIGRELCRLQRYLVASPAYLERHGAPATPQDLARHVCIVSSYTTIWEFTGPDGRQAIQPQQAVIANDQDVIRELLLQGAGIGVVTDAAQDAAIASGELLPLLKGYEMVGRSLHLVYPSRELLSPQVRQFVDLAVKVYAE